MGHALARRLLVLFLFFSLSSTLWGEITVAAFDGASPIVVVNEDGSVTGFYPEVLKTILGEEVVFLSGLSFSEAYDRVKKGEIDLLPGAIRTSQREKELLFNKQPFLVSWSEVFVGPDVYIENIFDLRNARVALMEGDQNGRNFINFMADFDIPFTPVYFPSYKEAVEAVEKDHAAALVSFSTFNAQGRVKSVGIVFSPTQAFIATAREGDRELLDRIDRGLKALKENEESVFYKELIKWFHYVEVETLPGWTRWALRVGATLILLAVFFLLLQRYLLEKSRNRMLERERQFDKALARADLNYRLIADFNYDWEFWLTPRGDFLYCSPSCLRHTGYEALDFLEDRKLLEKLFHPDDRAHWLDHLERDISATHRESLYRLYDREGNLKWFKHQCRPIYDDEDRFLGHRGSFVDITDQKNYESALEKAEHEYRVIVENTKDLILTVDEALTVTFVNSRVKEFLAAAEDNILGKHLLSVLGSEGAVDEVRECLIRKEPRYFEMALKEKGGEETSIYFTSATPVTAGDHGGSVILYCQNISDQQNLERQLLRSQRLESVGVITGGIAHDFNNLLTPILGYGEIIESSLAPDDPNREYLAQLKNTSLRAKDLVEKLLIFSKRQDVKYDLVKPGELLREFEHLLRAAIRSEIVLELDILDEDITILSDPGQLEQIVMNLVLNARDAIPSRGRITLSIRPVELAEDQLIDRVLVQAGSYCLMEVSDTGTGMDDETLNRIFDPFFSTKGDRGTGLGLSSVFGIVGQLGGYITVRSSPGEGSVFSLFFPVPESLD